MKPKFFMVAAILLSSRLCQAQDDSIVTIHEFSYRELSGIIVTAHKSEQPIGSTGKVLTVIYSSQIEQSKGRTISEVLNSVPGVSINGANNNLGTNQTINIRGASAGNVLVLIDGIPINDPSALTNYYDLNFLPIDQVERIEILKGGQSTLYGSDAVAGVINIITKKSKKRKFALNASAAAGSYATSRNNIGINGTLKRISYNLQYSNVFSRGFSSAYDSTGKKNFDNDGYKQHVVYAGLNFAITKKLHATVNGRFSRYKTDVDAAAFVDDKDFTSISRNWQGQLALSYKLANGSITGDYSYNKVVRTYTDDSTDRPNPFAYYSNSRYEGITHFAELYGNYKWEHTELLLGADFRKNKTNQDYLSVGSFGPYSSSLPDSMAHMWQLSPYASLILKNEEGLSIEGGVRWNHHSTYGNNFTYTFNPCYLINQKLKLFGNLYSAFKTPTLYQLFDPYSGNKDLKPEKSTIVEGGIEYFASPNFRTRLVYFDRNTKNAIQFVLVDPNFFTYQYSNSNRQKSHGWEWEMGYKADHWRFDANYTYTRGKTISGFDETGNSLSKDTSYSNLYHIPKSVINVSAGYYLKKLYVSVQARTVGKRLEPVYASAPKTLNSYYTIDVYSEYGFSAKWKVFLDLRNITNQRYFDILGYNSRRFNFMTGISLNL